MTTLAALEINEPHTYVVQYTLGTFRSDTQKHVLLMIGEAYLMQVKNELGRKSSYRVQARKLRFQLRIWLFRLKFCTSEKGRRCLFTLRLY